MIAALGDGFGHGKRAQVGDGGRLHGGEQDDLRMGENAHEQGAVVAHHFGQRAHGFRCAVREDAIGLFEGLRHTAGEHLRTLLGEPRVVGAGRDNNELRFLMS